MTLPKTELPLDDGPDARPKIAAGRDGKLIVTFATRDDKYNGHAFIARSEDGGKSFSAPMPITTNSPSQRFETATIDEDGRAFLAWIDKRDAAAAKAAEQAIRGSGARLCLGGWRRRVAARRRGSRGTTPASAAASPYPSQVPASRSILFRNIFDGGIRDHAVITFSDPSTPGTLHRVSDDDAELDACPHQGPSLSIGRDGTYHATWLALGKQAERALLRALDRWRRDIFGANAARRCRAAKFTSLCPGRARCGHARLQNIRWRTDDHRGHDLARLRRILEFAASGCGDDRRFRPSSALIEWKAGLSVLAYA